MIPVFYIGNGCGEIHLKMDKQHNVTIKVSSISRGFRKSFMGKADKVTINGILYPEFEGRIVTYTLLCEVYRISVGKELKYGSVISARTNLVAVQKIIEEVAPSLFINFKPKPVEIQNISIDDQIFNAWVKNV